MRNLKFIFIALAMLMTMFACQKTYVSNRTTVVVNGYAPYTIPQNQWGEYGIIFGNYGPATKALVTSTSGTGYDDFNLFAWNSVNDTIMKPYSVIATGANTYDYTSVSGQELQYFRSVADNYEFIGVIPTSNNMTLKDGVVTVKDIESFTLEDNRISGTLTADSPKEFLWAYDKVEKSNYGSVVTLPFEHGDALLYLEFTSDDSATELIDYVPATSGYNVYTATATTIPVLGPAITDINISDSDIDYINSHYTASKGFTSYQSSNVIEGDLSTDMYAYLVNKYPALSTATLNNWDSYVSNSNMRLVHISKTGVGNCYDGVFINVQNVNWSSYTVSGNSGIEGIRVFSTEYSTDHYIHKAYTSVADASISANGLSFVPTVTSTDVIPFALPATVGTSTVASPTTFYIIPCDITSFVVKFSYTYKGITVYDVRVALPIPSVGLVAGKYYKYTINITSTGNGTNDPGEAETNKDEVDVQSNPTITVTANFADYGLGFEQTLNI